MADEDNDFINTCHRAVVKRSGDVVVLNVISDGESFVSSLEYARNFPDDEPDELFSEQMLAADFIEDEGDKYILAEGTGRVIEVSSAGPRTLVNLETMLGGIARLTDGQVAVFGPDGRFFIGGGTAWREVPGLSVDVLGAVGDAKNGLYVCGNNGLFARLQNNRWQQFDLGTNASLNALLPTGRDELLICGNSGIFGRWSAGSWSFIEAPALDFYDLAAYRNEIYIGAGSDGLYKLKNDQFALVKDNVFSYALRSSDKFMAIAGENEAVRFDGRDFPYLAFDDTF
ncbi:hypothetical protein EOA23_16495 [Mesorhizobium sp. M2A.F.Ca.ET.042.01.1.1]|uniref:hypothetical protein n=1 Tax=Mesorhizobium sp. M2A.F.Ca.ET.042.01.1.1 TaxID=2496745 RepID=UPI000FCB11E8|nr:hypothetical protein [Mesorhizobium sp. M2A.F.Ca.ET.042.01.1.1]RUX27797.1 hypothetical protein EOA23_16495 [Mesorhizobium sp. M2A.F.Ca.ET.042.01.1.1]